MKVTQSTGYLLGVKVLGAMLRVKVIIIVSYRSVRIMRIACC